MPEHRAGSLAVDALRLVEVARGADDRLREVCRAEGVFAQEVARAVIRLQRARDVRVTVGLVGGDATQLREPERAAVGATLHSHLVPQVRCAQIA